MHAIEIYRNFTWIASYLDKLVKRKKISSSKIEFYKSIYRLKHLLDIRIRVRAKNRSGHVYRIHIIG